MSTLSAEDRVSLCMFSFADGRRCRTPRVRNNPHFCFYHAEKEARARAAQNLGKDLARYFSGDYLSACDLSTALGCLIPAVIRGDIKPKVARTVAYLAQTLLQAIHTSQDEYINTFGTDGWRKSICTSVNANHNYRFPPAPDHSGGLQAGPQTERPSKLQPQRASAAPSPPPQPAPVAHPACPEGNGRVRGEAVPSTAATSPAAPQTAAQQPTPSPHTSSLPPTAAEFAQHVLAGLQTGEKSSSRNAQPASPRPQPAEQLIHTPQTPAAPAAPSHTACHPERSEGSQVNHAAQTTTKTHPIPTSQPTPPPTPAVQPTCPEQSRRVNPREPNREAPWLNWSATSNIPPDSHLL
jgi:hypothetical protein